jgi:sulfatase maturation enzyme AslB (radical SAM superfamily)
LSRRELLGCIANDQLHLVVMPTEACNFRCTYCYEDFRYTRMEPEVVRGLVARRRFTFSKSTGSEASLCSPWRS